MGRMLTLIIHSLQTRSPSLLVFSDSEGRVAALDLEAQALATGSAEEGQDGHGGLLPTGGAVRTSWGNPSS